MGGSDLKQYLKTLKMNESRISAIIGGLIIAVIAIMVFNYFRNMSGVTTPTSISTETTPSTQTTYTVEAGDSLWTIAQEQLGDGYRWSEIAELNNITGNHLSKGQQLILPSTEVATTTQSTSAPAATTIAEPTPVDHTEHEVVITGEAYTVVKGDNLWTIAENAYGDGFQWKKIAEANKLENPRVIHSGNSLTLPR